MVPIRVWSTAWHVRLRVRHRLGRAYVVRLYPWNLDSIVALIIGLPWRCQFDLLGWEILRTGVQMMAQLLTHLARLVRL